ncbi:MULTISPECIES: sugar ABC transporter ATP-binding protein [unclassified Oceanispirochaeta]|uniref:sugar ABC transporter ATP-binding protein n=1 Tax=unclassified Oceanispirochaeta TaxID=2635722 RepID=UPI000E0999D8|nr:MULTISPECIES: sugar ABC transporter ATP-binding protein [unclassified Oceanispirochaeta]MBF9014625.1 sugar ABC transporter ATP-binding protein [Oceanispirochaeta sp. M2]NPD70881.1 sugar ABC transporter ATP-binding protein [Oceanispirochaeta sp. M1]RDG34160.1 sugar ABC transporter ATP-binding protein [Oceanispirochaeta sp. M1]
MEKFKLQTECLRKVYPGTVALDDFTVGFDGGKVHAIIGKNGSGKSTLIKIISGAINPTSGILRVDGLEVKMDTPLDAFDKGIATVYQELSLIPDLTVAENILLGRLVKTDGLIPRIDWKASYAKAQRILDEMEVDISVDQAVKYLSVGQQQVIEIAKAMSYKPLVLMLDEPTSALAAHEVNSLFTVIRKLKEKGVAILYISHRLQELNEIADTVTVIRDGHFIGKIDMQDASSEQIVHMMFGDVEQKHRPSDLKIEDETVLEVKGLSDNRHFSDISFSVKKGEILGIAGMLGSGRTELLRSIFGADKLQEGSIIFNGREITNPDPVLMKSLGMGLTPENRKEEGLVQVLSTNENLCLASLDRIGGRGGYINRKMEEPYIKGPIEKLHALVPRADLPVSSLSGGNQQKIVVGNWLNTNPQLMIYDEPSRGIDVQAKQQIFQIMWDLSREGISSLVVSSELEELLEICHRILIMRQGRIIDQVKPEDLRIEQLYAMCMEA